MNIVLLKYKLKKLLCPSRILSKEYISFLASKGVFVGEGTHFFYPCSNTVDIQRPWLLSIGSYCKITEGVSILTHDYSRSVLRLKYGEILAEARRTRIGNNVFIGMKSVILMGADIGDNVVIGAGSIVTGKIPSNSVVAGNPARVICSLDEFYKKRKKNLVKEAVIYFKAFVDFYKKEPSLLEMGAFYPLFLNRSVTALTDNHINTKLSGDNQEDIVHSFLESKPLFDSYESFKYYANQFEL